MKAVLMRRHQTMADVVPITTLLAILICIGYCSDTAWGTDVLEQSPQQSEELSIQPQKVVQKQLQALSDAVQLQPGTAGATTPGQQSPDEEALEALRTSVAAEEAVTSESNSPSSGQGSTKGMETTEEAQSSLPQPGAREITEETQGQKQPPLVSDRTDALDTPGQEDISSPLANKHDSGLSLIPSIQSEQTHQENQLLLTPSVGGQTEMGSIEEEREKAKPEESLPVENIETKLASPAETPAAPSAPSTPIEGAPLTPPQEQRITPVSQYTPTGPSTSTQAKADITTETDAGTTADSETSAPVTVKVTAPGDTAGTLPETTTTEAATLSATTPRAGDAQTPGTAITATGHTGNTVAMPAVKGETSLTSKAGHTPQPATGATTLTDVTVKGPQSSGAHTTVTEHTPPVDTAGTLSGTTDSRTTRQGPSPPAGASQASADVTVQQGPTPEEKKEQQKEVTGITPQAPRQEGQQQKGQTPQGPPPLGSTSGATPGKDNTRETAKTPPTGTDTNNNNNNITIPKIAVNETIISATVVPSAIPAVLVCSVVFLYLSRR